MNWFVSSVSLENHPLKMVSTRIRNKYYFVLEYFVRQIEDDEYTKERLKQYRNCFLKNGAGLELLNKNVEETVYGIVHNNSEWYKEKCSFAILCDMALILLDEGAIREAADLIKSNLLREEADLFEKYIQNKSIDIMPARFRETILEQYYQNCDFFKLPQKRFIVTANISAGKSTLINALIGKTLARTSQEICTGNICYFYNKPFEDGYIHLKTKTLNLNANPSELKNFDWDKPTLIASYFRGGYSEENTLCIIDTPGVNAALHKEHGESTYTALKNEKYDKLIYVFGADKLGTEEESKHLKWIAENIPKEKVIFVLNKLDGFKKEDNLAESMEKLQTDLSVLGYKDPKICPISAYFALLITKKEYGEEMTEDEEDQYVYYVKKFSREAYDFSGYYKDVTVEDSDRETVRMSKRCGFYGLKKVLFKEGEVVRYVKREKTKSKKDGAGMKNVLIKYNPYKLETEITIDGKELKANSRLREVMKPGHRLQEWVETLPEILLEEQGETKFDLTFHGILSDYEDVVEVFTKAHKELGLKVQLDRIPAKETSDKEKLIENVFQRILRESPFEELKDKEIRDSFNKVKSSDFEVCVVATMSAGKSTLINAMLGTRLMPSKQEACTAIITKIKDVDNKYEKGKWRAKVYNKAGKLTETHEEIDFSKMNTLNENENIARIEMEGDIPFVSAEDISLVLVDTPEPNNARNKEYKEIQSSFLDSSSKTLVLYIMEPTFGSDSDNGLLQRVSESMKVGGKQSKDRFIFILNKMDDMRCMEDGEVKDILKRTRCYLEKHGISDPNLFPAAALPALNIRLVLERAETHWSTPHCREYPYIRITLEEEELDEDFIDETDMIVRKFNRRRNGMLHLEQYSPLPRNIKDKIQKDAESARESNNAYQEALIHTGIVSIEAAICQYIQKYAKTAKIKNLVDIIQYRLDSVQYFTKLQKDIVNNSKKREEINRKLSEIKEKIDSIQENRKFKQTVDDVINNTRERHEKILDNTFEELHKEQLEKLKNIITMEKIPLNKTDEIIEKFKYFVEKLKQNVQMRIGNLIYEDLCKITENLIESYKKKFVTLEEEMDLKNNSGIFIAPFKFKPLTHFQEEKYKKEEYIFNVITGCPTQLFPWKIKKSNTQTDIPAQIMIQKFSTSISDILIQMEVDALKYEKTESTKIADYFMIKVGKLDTILKSNLELLQKCTNEKEDIEKDICRIEHNLDWLKDIERCLNEIVEI